MWSLFRRGNSDGAAEREKIAREDSVEREKIARLERAEAEVADLKARSARAVQFLDARHNRNHWAESIQQMIQGA